MVYIKLNILIMIVLTFSCQGLFTISSFTCSVCPLTIRHYLVRVCLCQRCESVSDSQKRRVSRILIFGHLIEEPRKAWHARQCEWVTCFLIMCFLRFVALLSFMSSMVVGALRSVLAICSMLTSHLHVWSFKYWRQATASSTSSSNLSLAAPLPSLPPFRKLWFDIQCYPWCSPYQWILRRFSSVDDV